MVLKRLEVCLGSCEAIFAVNSWDRSALRQALVAGPKQIPMRRMGHLLLPSATGFWRTTTSAFAIGTWGKPDRPLTRPENLARTAALDAEWPLSSL